MKLKELIAYLKKIEKDYDEIKMDPDIAMYYPQPGVFYGKGKLLNVEFKATYRDGYHVIFDLEDVDVKKSKLVSDETIIEINKMKDMDYQPMIEGKRIFK